MERKNVLIIHTDELRYDCLGCNGNTYVKTPNIDKLAQSGTIFSRHISTNTVCMPSRASLFTGLYPPSHNVWDNGVPLIRKRYNKEVQDDSQYEIPTIADMFRESGYDTVSFGKLHLTPSKASKEYGYEESESIWDTGELDDWHGSYYGFQYVDITKGHGEAPCHRGHYSNWLRDNHPDAYRKLYDMNREEATPFPDFSRLYAMDIPNELHHSTWLADRFNQYIDSKKGDTPFFAFVGFPDPHHPFTPTKEIMEMFENAEVKIPEDRTSNSLQDTPVYEFLNKLGYLDLEGLSDDKIKTIIQYTYAMIYQIDLAVGKIVTKLSDKGLMDNTIIVFTSDHGDFLGDYGMVSKANIGCDALLHIPLIIRAPGYDLPSRVDTPISNCDILPTLANMARIPITNEIQGEDILDIIENKDDRTVMAYCMGGNMPKYNNISIYDKNHRLTYYPNCDFTQLFSHENDPYELIDRAEDQAYEDIKNKLLNYLKNNFLRHSNPILGKVSKF